MIKELLHSDQNVSKEIRSVFQLSYAVEAKLLNAVNFPPIERKLTSFIESENTFWGVYVKQKIVAVAEIRKDENFIHIQSLVVLPNYFRQGIASQLMKFIIDSYNTTLFMVETGLKNDPAIQLYSKFGFIEVKQWDTKYGIRKVRFERKVIGN